MQILLTFLEKYILVFKFVCSFILIAKLPRPGDNKVIFHGRRVKLLLLLPF